MAKPAKTKIKLRKQEDRLELLLPLHKQLDRAGKHQVGLTLMVDGAALLLVGLSIWLGININIKSAQENQGVIFGLATGLLFVLPLALWVLGAACKNSVEMCKQLFSNTSVSIDRKQLALSSKFWNFDWGAIRRIKVKDIQRVVTTDYQYMEGVRNHKAPCYVVLEIDGQGTINLFTAEHRLTQAEAKWLGKEISRWLGIQFGGDVEQSEND
jgi:hypothetical protein